MNKHNSLGIVIEYTQQGTFDLMSLNSDSRWTKYTGDIAEIKRIHKPANQKWSLEVLQKIDCGYIIRIFCPNAGRLDYICASIFVPWNLIISGKELCNIISATKEELFSWRRENAEAAKSRLTSLFSKTYEIIDLQPNTHELASNKIAYRYYGDFYQLHELLDSLDQPYYSNYKYIFLFDKDSNLSCDNCDDLSTQKLIETTIIYPPQDIDGFTPYIGPVPFQKPIRVPIGKALKISWMQKGLKTIDKTTMISSSDTILDKPTKNDHEIEIPYNSIYVSDEKKGIVHKDDCTIIVNGKVLNSINKVYVNRIALNKVHICVTHSNTDIFEPSEGDYDLSKAGKFKLDIQLKRVQLEYSFMFPLKRGGYRVGSFVFATKKLYDCPFEGFNIKEGRIVSKKYGDNYLELNIWTKSRIIKLLVMSLVILCIGICSGWYISKTIYSKQLVESKGEIRKLKDDLNKKNSSNDSRFNPNPHNSDNKSNYKRVVDYMDSHPKWTKSEMDALPGICNLWDDINNYRFDKILKYKEDLKDSKKFRKLVEAITKHKKVIEGRFCSKEDTEITIDSYIKALEKKLSSERNQNRSSQKKQLDTNDEQNKDQNNW